MSAPASTAALPQRLGRYEVLSLLGRGAMGSVYKAHDPSLQREVAVKTVGGVLLEAAEHREEYLERFQREARAAAGLSHPNIVAVYDLGVDAETGTPFIVMEYVPGVSLATLLRENAELPVVQAFEIADQVAAALEEAHRHGIVHRDIKPGNVFIDPRGRVKVGDFGIARTLGSELTETGVGLGTPGYVAPEVVRGGRADARADVFALGALTYTLLAGRKPFPGVTPQALTAEVLENDPEAPHLVRPAVPPSASDAVMHALVKSPEGRTPTVSAFRGELTSSAPGSGAGRADLPATAHGGDPTVRVATAAGAAGPSATMTVAVPPRATGRRLSAAWAAALLLAVALVAWLIGARGGQRPAAPPSPAAAAAPAGGPVRSDDAAPAPSPARQPTEPRPVVVAEPPERGRSAPPGRAHRSAKPGKGHARGRGKEKKKD